MYLPYLPGPHVECWSGRDQKWSQAARVLVACSPREDGGNQIAMVGSDLITRARECKPRFKQTAVLLY